MKRIESIDIVRGIVMVIMALDHTRDFMHIDSLTQNPLDLATTTPLLFLTRWITHLCAPVFVFLAGTSAYLYIQKQKDYRLSRNFLITRGLWFIILEFTVINFALWFDIHFRILLFQVIAAMGFGFIVLALLMKVPLKILVILALLIISGHDLLSSVQPDNPFIKSVLSPVINFNSWQVSPKFTFVIAYPFLPWFGIMLAGFVTGQLFNLEEAKRKKLFLMIGSGLLLLFFLIRFVNLYGDPSAWSVQKNTLFTILSFINTSKYPPSLLFSLMTLGIMFLLLYAAESIKNKFIKTISIFGKVPFFYYLIHLYLIHSVLLLIMFLQGFRWSDLSFEPFRFGRPEPTSGIELWTVYLVWLGVILLLFPVCRWYAKFKSEHGQNKLLKYL